MNELITVDRYLNDLGQYNQSVAPVGKYEVTILDNLRLISNLLHGRIVSSVSITGRYKVYISKRQFVELLNAYISLVGYKLSENLSTLIQKLKEAYSANQNSDEIGIDRIIVSLIHTVHNEIVITIGDIWNSTVGLRLISCSGTNYDVSLEGDQQILDRIIKKLTPSEINSILDKTRQCGQLAGLRTTRQTDVKDLLTDLLFGRKGTNASLQETFDQISKQRDVLRRFRTDVLCTPVSRYADLPIGVEVSAALNITISDTAVEIVPKSFGRCRFEIRNITNAPITVLFSGNEYSGSVIVPALGMIKRSGTKLTINDVAALDKIRVIGRVDLRKTKMSNKSMLTLAIDGKLGSDEELSAWFLELCTPILPYLDSIVEKLKTEKFLSLTFKQLGQWAVDVIDKLMSDSLYESWLTQTVRNRKEHILFLYLLLIVVPELLMNPILTFTDTQTTPPYLSEYSMFVGLLKEMFE